MSDKKECREYWISHITFGFDSWWHVHTKKPVLYDDPEYVKNRFIEKHHVIEHAAFEAEKQRADRLEKEKAEAIERSYELHKKDRAENQKLKEALEAYASIDEKFKVPAMKDGSCLVPVNALAKMALK